MLAMRKARLVSGDSGGIRCRHVAFSEFPVAYKKDHKRGNEDDDNNATQDVPNPLQNFPHRISLCIFAFLCVVLNLPVYHKFSQRLALISLAGESSHSMFFLDECSFLIT